jgi:Rod binding domain-containing protein
MSTVGGTSSSLSNAASAAATLPGMTPVLGRGAKAAREFEAQLIGSVLESMEKTFAGLPGKNPMAGEDDYNYLGTHALAGAMAEAGGIGIGNLIAKYLSQHGPSAAKGGGTNGSGETSGGRHAGFATEP